MRVVWRKERRCGGMGMSVRIGVLKGMRKEIKSCGLTLTRSRLGGYGVLVKREMRFVYGTFGRDFCGNALAAGML